MAPMAATESLEHREVDGNVADLNLVNTSSNDRNMLIDLGSGYF